MICELGVIMLRLGSPQFTSCVITVNDSHVPTRRSFTCNMVPIDLRRGGGGGVSASNLL